ncbi:alpha/beta hydrolase [Planctomycetes bacterium K23_9]|uniref:Alpha/beta hydrolase family protein n=1 Tax=Stieleria marina TaxID=1930275 RepID=A0A517P356_9BACT|nr:Alpha/beta hydrolase family protein [Planctomycetes bacterium K23_9]
MTEFVFSLAIAVVIALALWQIIGCLIAQRLLYSNHHSIAQRRTPEQFGHRVTRLTIPVDRHHNLAAWMLSPSPDVSLDGACIVMVHGFSGGKDKLWSFPSDDYQASTLEQGGAALVNSGFHVVAIDLRNHGDSDDNGPVTLGARESDDVLSTLDYLRNHAGHLGIDANRIGLRGESMGGATCLIAGARDQENQIRAIWSDSAFAEAASAIPDFMRHKNIPTIFALPARFWLTKLAGVHLNEASPLRRIGMIHCPVFLTHSNGDAMLPIRHLEILASSEHWQQTPQIWSLAQHAHNRLWREPEYHQRQIDFFRLHLANQTIRREAA